MSRQQFRVKNNWILHVLAYTTYRTAATAIPTETDDGHELVESPIFYVYLTFGDRLTNAQRFWSVLQIFPVVRIV